MKKIVTVEELEKIQDPDVELIDVSLDRCPFCDRVGFLKVDPEINVSTLWLVGCAFGCVRRKFPSAIEAARWWNGRAREDRLHKRFVDFSQIFYDLLDRGHMEQAEKNAPITGYRFEPNDIHAVLRQLRTYEVLPLDHIPAAVEDDSVTRSNTYVGYSYRATGHYFPDQGREIGLVRLLCIGVYMDPANQRRDIFYPEFCCFCRCQKSAWANVANEVMSGCARRDCICHMADSVR